MSKTSKKLIDFRDLISAVPGEGLEELVRQIGNKKNLFPEWSGRGADGGRDLFFTEIQEGAISKNKIRWLVSCKDKAESEQSVSENDLPATGIKDKLAQHKAEGFLLVTTTTVSTGAKNLLDNLDVKNGGHIHTHVWDFSELTNILLKKENQDLLKQFLPKSYERVNQLTTLEGALYAHKEQLPDDVFSEVINLIKPYSTQLKGLNIWSYDSKVAENLDLIVESLIRENDLNKAIAKTEGIGYDEYLAFVDALKDVYPERCFEYLWKTITYFAGSGLSYNAFYFLADHYKLTKSDLIKLAPCLDDEFTLTKNSEIVQSLEDILKKQDSEYLNELSKKVPKPVIKSINGLNIVYFVSHEARVEFAGTIQLEVGNSDEFFGEKLYSAYIDGYFNENTVSVETFTI